MVTAFVNERCMETQLKNKSDAQMRRNSQFLVYLVTFIAKYNMYRILIKNICVEIKNVSRWTYVQNVRNAFCVHCSWFILQPVQNNRESQTQGLILVVIRRILQKRSNHFLSLASRIQWHAPKTKQKLRKRKSDTRNKVAHRCDVERATKLQQ